jgi:anti-sigma factor RsiW
MTHRQAVDTFASERYLLGDMTELERHSFEDHYFSCEECAEEVRIGALMEEGVKTAFASAPRSGAPIPTRSGAILRPARWWSPRSTLIPWAAAAVLALVAGAESLLIAPSLRHGNAPQAITPITLRPASRGAAPIVSPGANGSVLLAVDVNASPAAGELAYELRAPGGAQVAAGRVPAPTAGTPLYLLFPAGTLTARGEYVLLIRDATSSDRTVGEYRFTVGE